MHRLSRRLKKETTSEHRLAEATRFAKAFFRGQFNRRTYARGLALFEPVYAALENALQSDEALRPFWGEAHLRAPAIRTDLARFGPRLDTVPSAYSRRINAVASDDPLRTLGHFYVRYFADLSGVARVAPMAHRLLRIDRREPMAFFSFPKITDMRAYKNGLRALLDGVPEEAHERVLDEARRSFELHRQLVDQLFETLKQDEVTAHALESGPPPS
ncbi:MAG: biliverdin-producing heme oxygenase [Myxococcota bacterium]